MTCVTQDQVLAFLGEALDVSERRSIEAHVDACEECLELMTIVSMTSMARPAAGSHDERGGEPRNISNESGEQMEDYNDLGTVDRHHYVIGHEIARGGMGRIVAARDRRLGRPVAIKELLIESAGLRARFEREARITARLQHPAIVNVLEAGTWPGGDPFYAMRLVSGDSLDRVLARCSTLDARLALLPIVIAAADALAYAHSNSVIHRDVKPANVLVGEFGETVVIDWGFAKDLADTEGTPEGEVVGRSRGAAIAPGATIAGTVIGTPAYMPPEQAAGEAVDARADVYALGAILYHVLAGTPPYVATTTKALLSAVIAGPPRPLDDCTPGAPPDLLAIVDKAMSRTAADRYPTAKGLADDLKKFQTGQLVGAHHYSKWQLVRRWIGRHRAAVAVTAAAAVLLAVLGAVSLRRVVREQDRADQQREVAERSRRKAEGLMNFMLIDLRNKASALGRLELLDDVAKKAVAYYDEPAGDANDTDLFQRATAQSNLADVLKAQGHADAALREYRAALAITLVLAANDPTRVEYRAGLVSHHNKIGHVLRAQGDLTGALAEYRAASTVAEALAAHEPSNANRRRSLALGYMSIGDIMLERGDVAAALEKYRATLAIAKALAEQNPADGERQRFLSASHISLGDALRFAGDTGRALAEYQAALEIAQTLAASEPHNADRQEGVWAGHLKVGDVLLARGTAGQTLAEYRAGLEIAEMLATSDPSNTRRQFQLSITHNRVGDALFVQGITAQALAEYRAALAIDEKLATLDPTNSEQRQELAVSHLNCGNVHLAQGDVSGALVQYRAGLTVAEKLTTKDPSSTAWGRDLAAARTKIGDGLLAGGDHDAALQEYRAGLALLESAAATDPSNAERQADLSACHNKVGDALQARGDVAAALEERRAALAIDEALARKDPTNSDHQAHVSNTRRKVGEALLAQGDAAGALAECRAALAVDVALDRDDPTNADRRGHLAASHRTIGDALLAQKKRDEALAEYRAALVMTAALAEIDPSSSDRHRDLAIDHEKVGDVLFSGDDKMAACAEYKAGLTVAERWTAGDFKLADAHKLVVTLTSKLASCRAGGIRTPRSRRA